MTDAFRLCPNCETRRPLSESFCEGVVDGAPCDWDLTSVPIGTPAPPPPPPPSAERRCPQGHPVAPDDLVCLECGADPVETSAPPPGADPPDAPSEAETSSGPTVIHAWRLLRSLGPDGHVREQFVAEHETDGRRAVLTLYACGAQPDQAVHEALRRMDTDHIPELYETGTWEGRAYEVSEEIGCGILTQVGLDVDNPETIRTVTHELWKALRAFAECGLRHRDLRPANILVRTVEPLDLVITGFGSARLSELDLDIESPLESTVYMAPEAIMGGVSPSSDWWSLGMILLELVTGGACFRDIPESLFLIQVMTKGAPIPSTVAPGVRRLLQGLLVRDRRQRWKWTEVGDWLDGKEPPIPDAVDEGQEAVGPGLPLGGRSYHNPRAWALEAARAEHWDEAAKALARGQVATWAETAKLDSRVVSGLRNLTQRVEVPEDFRLAVALKLLNPVLPLIQREVIVTPGWLLENPEAGYALVSGPVPSLLEEHGMESEDWLIRLARRVETVREKARRLEIELDEESLRVHVLCASHARLAALWEERRQLMPDSEHAGIVSLLERPHLTDEDLVILNAAREGQFRGRDEILARSLELARALGLESEMEAATGYVTVPRRRLYAELDRRLESFSRCGQDRLDAWADEFRLEHRIPLERAIVLLALAPERWQKPPHQEQAARLLGFFEKKVAGAILRGPLVRMTIGRTTPRIDLCELVQDEDEGQALLDRIVARVERSVHVDPTVFADNPTLEPRLRSLVTRTQVFHRDTGINGLYLGFPFLLKRDRPGRVRPRLAPVLLWPVKVNAEVGGRGRVTLAFDRDRDDVRLNPAFEGLLGLEEAKRWTEAARDLLGRGALRVPDVMDALGILASPAGRCVTRLPDKDADLPEKTSRLECAAVLFHVEFLGQAIVEDLRNLKAVPPAGSALESLLRIDGAQPKPATGLHETSQFLVCPSDPSQEQAISLAWSPPGLLVQGPPGTGKSQTIVNLVADAIGRGRAVLVVCQKLPALEVVRKRLAAEGLGQRFVMVTNVNHDRRPILQAIRAQLETLPPPSVGGDRRDVAARIVELEQFLDRHHGAIYRKDEVSGKSYREILGALLEVEQGAWRGPDLPALSRLLATALPGMVARLEDDCGSLAAEWLPAHFEGSPLDVLAAFPSDDGTVQEFQDLFERLAQSERVRADLPAGRFEVEDDSPLADWLGAHRGRLLSLSPSSLVNLSTWLPLFQTSTGAAWIEALERLRTRAQALPGGVSDADLALVGSLADADLAEWIRLLALVTRDDGWWGRVNPLRWLAGWKMDRALAERGRANGDGVMGVVLQAATVERDLRPIRRELHEVTCNLGRGPRDDLLALSPPRAVLYLADLVGQLRETQDLAQVLAACPVRLPLEQAARTGKGFQAAIEELERILARCRARQRSQRDLVALDGYMTAEWQEQVHDRIRQSKDASAHIEPIFARWSTIGAYQRFRARAAGLDGQAREVFALLARLRDWLETLETGALGDQVRRIIRRQACLGWKSRLEAGDPVLMASRTELETKIARLAEAEQEMRRLNRRFLATHVDRGLVAPIQRWEDITRLQGPRAVRLREFFARGTDLGLLALRPVWLMIPEVASQLLPLTRACFDLVVYDEASQMPVEMALPTLYRSRVSVVSGDEKQMPPTSFFASRVESDEADLPDFDEAGSEETTEEQREVLEEAWNRKEIKDCPDLLHLAMAALPHATLQVHYRSEYRPLIAYSNAAFYSDQLSVPACHPDDEVRRLQPIRVIEARGVYVEQTNKVEAGVVVDFLADLWAQPGPRPSVGIVTFNRKQADRIEERLEQRAEVDAAFKEVFAQELERVDGGENMAVFVKNVENVQGDERDVIIFSTTFGRNQHGVFRRNFGVLGQKGGERRLNVAVTRARRNVVVVTSMPIEDISDFLSTRRAPAGPRDYLQAYLEYARLVSSGQLDAARALVARFTPSGQGRGPADGRRDGLARSVEKAIRELGHEPVPMGNDPTLAVSYAIVHPRTGLFGIGIECEIPAHPLLRSARAREVWRRRVLGRAYPTVHRVAAREWYHDGERERLALADAIRRALT